MSVPAMTERALRVLMTADAVGGVWTYALDLASALRAHRVETVLALLGPAPSKDQRAGAAEAGVTLVETDLPLDWTASMPGEVGEAARALSRLAAEIGPDIVHLNSPALAADARFAAPVVAVAHSCVATWWEAVRTGPLPPEFTWRTDLVRRGYLAAAAITAPSAAFAGTTARMYALPETPIVVPNGRRAHASGAVPSDLFVFTAGRLWDDGKDLATLDRAAARLAVPVLAAGPLRGPNGAAVTPSAVEALGRLDDGAVARHLARQPIFVSTALYEPFGLAVLEAAQAGCPLVLSDIPTFRELWDGAARFVPARDDGALACAVEELAGEPQARRRLGDAARRRAGAYTVEAMSLAYAALYGSLIRSPGARPIEDAA
jgi:glycosyltransferase involved in cell wall biosynthesis